MAIIILFSVFFSYSHSIFVQNLLKPIVTGFQKEFFHVVPCSEPIYYSIDSLDLRFNLSYDQLKSDLAKAANIWNQVLNKPLLTYDPTGPLKINLVYDNRQQTTITKNNIDSTISDNQASYDSLKTQYTSLLNQYNQDKISLESRIKNYKQELNAYNTEVNSWNSHGGASPAEVNKLQIEKQNLDRQAQALSHDQTVFNDSVITLNSTAKELDRLVQVLNSNIKTYNNIGSSVGEQFNEGEYIEDSSGTRIYIYQFKNEGQLVRVLEHEFGHALGLDHVNDPEAIMYYMNSGTNEKLTANDIDELETVCRK